MTFLKWQIIVVYRSPARLAWYLHVKMYSILKCNSIFHYMLATTTGGKNLGFVVCNKITQLLLFLFYYLVVWFAVFLPQF